MIGREDQDFNSVLIQSIHETVAQLLSPKVAESLFEHLEKFYSVKEDEIPFRLDKLLLALETNFGLRTSRVIGKAIAKRLYTRLGLEFTEDVQIGLQGYVEKVKMTHQK